MPQHACLKCACILDLGAACHASPAKWRFHGMAGQGVQSVRLPGRSGGQHLSAFLAELAHHTYRDAPALAVRDRVRAVVVEAVEGFVVEFDAQRLL